MPHSSTDPDRTETVPLDADEAFPPIRAPQSGEQVAGRYEILELLGRGGHAWVYRARDRLLDTEIALKLLRAGPVRSGSARRLLREAKISRSLRHPSLVRVFDVGATEDGHLFLVMELVDGETLAQRLSGGRLEVSETLEIAEQLLLALSHLHGQGFLHRDVKPSNVLLAETRTAKLADFGLAVAVDGRHTRLTATDATVGTVDYLSPEQALGKKLGPSSDLYSFGILLFEALTGRLPFAAGTSMGRVLQRLSERPPQPSDLAPGIDPWLDRFVQRLLEREPTDRYANAERALEDFRSRRVRRRRRRWLPATAVLVGAIVLVVALARWLPDRPRFDHLELEAGGPFVAVDARGRTLWTRARDIEGTAEGVRLRPGGPPRIVGFGYADERRASDAHRKLMVLDQETGEPVIPGLTLGPDAEMQTAFQDFGPNFHGLVRAEDLDGDGAHELLLTWIHFYQPSYTALFEPRLGRTRPLFAASGHHSEPLFVDLDGDGRKEILLQGTNNAMGWMQALAALRLDPPVGQPGNSAVLGRSPDQAVFDPSALAWYALVPARACARGNQCFSVDTEKRTLESNGSETWTIGFDGFPIDASSALATADRLRTRRAAYAALRRAEGMVRVGQPDEARSSFATARALAEQANDPGLLEWLRRWEPQLLARIGLTDQAVEGFERLAEDPGLRLDATFDAATAFHLSGDLTRAVEWYRRNLEDATGIERLFATRQHWETLEGLVLARAERGQWTEALAEIARFEALIPQGNEIADTYRVLVRWLEPGLDEVPDWPATAWTYDLRPYLQLEVRYEHEDEPRAALLEEVETELGIASFTRAPLQSLRALLLADLGRFREALAQARKALDTAADQSHDRVLVHALSPLIEERARDIERRAAARQEAP